MKITLIYQSHIKGCLFNFYPLFGKERRTSKKITSVPWLLIVATVKWKGRIPWHGGGPPYSSRHRTTSFLPGLPSFLPSSIRPHTSTKHALKSPRQSSGTHSASSNGYFFCLPSPRRRRSDIYLSRVRVRGAGDFLVSFPLLGGLRILSVGGSAEDRLVR